MLIYSIGAYWKLFFRAHFWVHVHPAINGFTAVSQEIRDCPSALMLLLCVIWPEENCQEKKKKRNPFLWNLLRNYSYYWKAWKKCNTRVFSRVETMRLWDRAGMHCSCQVIPRGVSQSKCFLWPFFLPTWTSFSQVTVMISGCGNMQQQEFELTQRSRKSIWLLGKDVWNNESLCVIWEIP